MDWLKKTINIKKYLGLSLVSIFIIEAFASRNYKESLVYLSIFLASFLNQLMLFLGLKIIFTMHHQRLTRREMFQTFLFLMGKTVILGSTLYIGILFVRERIIIGLFIYTVQLANIFFSLKKNSVPKLEDL